MRRTRSRWLVLAGLAAAACARPGPHAEIRFGAEAAERGLWREALLRFEKAAAARPGDPAALNDLAVAYESQDRIMEAFQAYRRAVEARPRDRRIRGNFDRFLERHRDRIRREGAAAGTDEAATPPAAGSEAK